MKIAISTSGGDAPGLNAVIHAATRAAIVRGHTMVGLRHGFGALLAGEAPLELDERSVAGIERTGGTMLGGASGGQPFGEAGTPGDVCRRLRDVGVDAIIMAGGDGTIRIAQEMAADGMAVVVVPKTIDRDVPETHTTFGFDTAVNTAAEALDRLHSTAESHQRVMVMEVMGRDSGWIALHAGMGGGACAILLPEFPFDPDVLTRHILAREAAGHSYHVLICSEGAKPAGGAVQTSARTGKYGGIAEWIATHLAETTGKDTRSVSLGHLLRGGAPSVRDRVLGLRFGSAAVSAVLRGDFGTMVAYVPPGFTTVPLERVAGRIRVVERATHELRTATNMGICFGTDALV